MSVELVKVLEQSQEQVNQNAGPVVAQVSRQFDKVHLWYSKSVETAMAVELWFDILVEHAEAKA